MPKHLVDPPNNQLANRLVGEGYSCIAKLDASNMTAYLFRKAGGDPSNVFDIEKIVLIRYGIAELYKEN
jgi:hypothetical protein